MNGAGLLLRKELLEQMRTLRLVMVVVVLAIFGGMSPLLAKLLPDIVKAAGAQAGGLSITMPPATTADAVAQLVKNLGQFGLLIAILVAMGAVATERERGTAGFVLTKPVGRSAFLAAKAAAIAVLLAAGVGAGYTFAWFYTAVLFEVLPLPGVIASAVALWLSLLALAAMTFLCSVLARSALVAGGAGFVALIVTSIVSAFPIVGPYMPTALWKPAVDLALGTDPGSVVGPAVASVAFVAGCLGLAAAAFRRQEL